VPAGQPCEDLYVEGFAFVARRGHPAAGKPLTAECVNALRHFDTLIVQGRGGICHSMAGEAFAGLGLARDAALAASRSDLVAGIPASLAEILCRILPLHRLRCPWLFPTAPRPQAPIREFPGSPWFPAVHRSISVKKLYSPCPMDSRLVRFRQPILALLCLACMAPVLAAEPVVKELRHPDGTLKERYSFLLDGEGNEVRTGLDEEFYPGGAKKGVRTWKDGRTEGGVTYWHPDGRKSYEAHYVGGKKNGFATVWYQNGQKQWQTTFKAGKTHGRWREWYPDGKRKFEADYHEGLLDGRATWWHENGRLWQERMYNAGLPVKGSVKEWDKQGRQTYPPPGDPSGNLEPGTNPTSVAPSATAAKMDGPR
jgi:hypothetical protein